MSTAGNTSNKFWWTQHYQQWLLAFYLASRSVLFPLTHERRTVHKNKKKKKEKTNKCEFLRKPIGRRRGRSKTGPTVLPRRHITKLVTAWAFSMFGLVHLFMTRTHTYRHTHTHTHTHYNHCKISAALEFLGSDRLHRCQANRLGVAFESKWWSERERVREQERETESRRERASRRERERVGERESRRERIDGYRVGRLHSWQGLMVMRLWLGLSVRPSRHERVRQWQLCWSHTHTHTQTHTHASYSWSTPPTCKHTSESELSDTPEHKAFTHSFTHTHSLNHMTLMGISWRSVKPLRGSNLLTSRSAVR